MRKFSPAPRRSPLPARLPGLAALGLLSLLLGLPVSAQAAPQGLRLRDGVARPLLPGQTQAPSLGLRRGPLGLRVELELGDLLVEQLQTKHQGPMARVGLAGAGEARSLGRPSLPVLRRFLPGTGEGLEVTVEALEVETWSLADLGLVGVLEPAQPPLPKLPGQKRPELLRLDEAYYATEGFEPSPLAQVVPAGNLAGQELALLELRPLRYDPRRGTLQVVRRARLWLRGPGLTTVTGAPLTVPAARLLHRLLPPELMPLQPLGLPRSTVAPIGYLVIVAESLADSPALAEWRRWRTEQGFAVQVASTAETGRSVSQISSFVESAWAAATPRPSFLLLVGDTDTIPNCVGRGDGTPPTDLCYATVAGDDYLADLGIGRFSARTEAQLATMVGKVLDYEAHTVPEGWETRSSLLAGVDNSHITEGTHEAIFAENLEPRGYSADRFYADSRNSDADDMVRALGEGRSLNIYSGHGGETGWVDGINFENDQVHRLTNEVLPFTLSFACVTGSYHLPESYGEAWLRAEAGAVGFLGSSVNSYWDEDDILERTIFEAFAPADGSEGIPWLSGMVQTGMAQFLQHYGRTETTRRYAEMYNLMGDPALQLWTRSPREQDLDVPEALPLGLDVLPVAALPAGALVAASRGGQLLAAAVADAAGRAELSLPPEVALSPEPLLVVSTAADYLPARREVQLVGTGDGVVLLGGERVGPYAALRVTVADQDLAGTETLSIEVSAEDASQAAPETLTLSEIPGLGVFRGELKVRCDGAAQPGVIASQDGQVLRLRYLDADDGQGGQDLPKDGTVVVDCAGPNFAGVRRALAGEGKVTLDWDLAEDAAQPIEYAVFRAEQRGGQDWGQPLARTRKNHFEDEDIENGRWYYYVVRAVDGLGNPEENLAEARALPRSPAPVMSFSLDEDPGWTLGRGWEYGRPQGRGGASGGPDPSRAYSGENVYGYNLAGDYEDNIWHASYLTAGPFDCSSISDTRVSFRRWLGVESADRASLEISMDGRQWQEVWANSSDVADRNWTLTTFDISSQADGAPQVWLRWGIGPTDFSVTYCGWNIDDVTIEGVASTDEPGRLELDRAAYRPDAPLHLLLHDRGGNLDPAAVEEVDVELGVANGALQALRCTETGPDTGVFALDLQLQDGGAAGPGKLAVQDGDTLRVLYHDPDDGTGLAAERSVEVAVDGAAPQLLDLRLEAVGSTAATLRWRSDEAALAQVRWGSSPAQLDQVAAQPEAALEQALTLTGLAPGQDYAFELVLSDLAGNEATFRLSEDQPYVFSTADEEGEEVLFRFDFETDPGWESQGDWTWGEPSGATGASGQADPDQAVSGQRTYGEADAGDYAANLSEPDALIAGPFNLSGAHDVALRVWRWLGVQPGDRAAIELSLDEGASWSLVWEATGGVQDDGWVRMRYALPEADDQSAVLLRFVLGPTDAQDQSCGWNLDDLELLGRYESSSAGALRLDHARYAVPATLVVTLLDADLTSLGPAPELRVRSATEPEGEPLVLTLQRSGVWSGSLALVYGEAAPDGSLQVLADEPLTVDGTDADDGSGASAPLSASAQAYLVPGAATLEIAPLGEVSADPGLAIELLAVDRYGRPASTEPLAAPTFSLNEGEVTVLSGPAAFEEGAWRGTLHLPQAGNDRVLRATAGALAAEIGPFSVAPGVPAAVHVATPDPVRPGVAFDLRLEVPDAQGNSTGTCEEGFEIEDRTGTLVVLDEALQDDGSVTLSLRVGAETESDVITVRCGALSGESGSFPVLTAEDEGCSCATQAPPGSSSLGLLLLGLALLGLRRRP